MIDLPKVPQGTFGPDMQDLSIGSKGPAVQLLQQALNFHLAFSSPPLVVDGIYGPKTEARASKFQKSCEITIDGIVGTDTARKLCSYVESRFHLLVVPQPVVRSQFSAGTIGIFGLSKPSLVSPYPSSAAHVVRQARSNGRLYLDFKNHLHIGVGTAGGGDFAYNFRRRAPQPKAFLATDLTVALGMEWKEKFGAEIGLGFSYEMSLGEIEEHEFIAFLFGKADLKLIQTEHFELPLAIQARLASPARMDEPPVFSANACLGAKLKRHRPRWELGLGFNVCFDYSVTKIKEGREKVWEHKLGPALGPNVEVRF